MSKPSQKSEAAVNGPLSGVRIIDMTTILMGPYATQTMGDYGADVIKIESPEGDLVRRVGAARNQGMAALFLNVNRSKRSLTIDLKQTEGRKALLRLCEDADILVYNIRAKAMERLGLGYPEVAAVNPRIIYAGLFGYGQDGPYAERPAYDDLIQGATTFPHLYTRMGGAEPQYVPCAIADRAVGLAAVGAILAALFHRERTGKGQAVEIPMFETMLGFVLGDHLGGLTYEPPIDGGGYLRHLTPTRRPYKTKDGYICALVYSNRNWESFFAIIDRENLPKLDDRYRDFAYRTENIDAVYSDLAKIYLTKTTEEWFAILEKDDIPNMPMHDLDSILSDPHLVATNFFAPVEHPSEGAIRSMAVPVKWSDTKTEPTRLAPRHGEHSIEVLLEAGYQPDEIADLLARKIIQSPDDVIEQFSPDDGK